MDNSWSLLKRFQPRDSHDSRADGLPHAGGRAQGSGGNGPAPQDPVLALGAIGMEDELIRSRISHMVERLEDVATLKSDFAALLEPIAAFGSEYPQLRAKLLETEDRKSTRLNSSHANISYAVFCLKKKKTQTSLPFLFFTLLYALSSFLTLYLSPSLSYIFVYNIFFL